VRHLDERHAVELREDHAFLHAVLGRDASRHDRLDDDPIRVRSQSHAGVVPSQKEGRPAGDDHRPGEDECQAVAHPIVEPKVHRPDTSRGPALGDVRETPE